MSASYINRPIFQNILLLALLCFFIPSAASCQDSAPSRIVSMAPNITRMVHDLGADHLLVGVTSFTPETPGSAVQIVGSPARINIEMTYSLKPLLVLAGTDCNSKSDIQALKKLGCRVQVFNGCESFECMCTTFQELAAILGRARQAEGILADVRTQMNALGSRIKGRKPMKVFWQLGDNPIVTASDKTFSGELLHRAGCLNVFGNAPLNYPRVNAEEVIKLNPDVIVVVSQMGQVSSPHSWSRFESLAAVRNRRVYEISADLVCQPTPVMYLKGYRAVLALLYPGVI